MNRAKLRRIRNKIYVRLRSRQCAKKYVEHYEALTDDFIENLYAELSTEEVEVLRGRRLRTKYAATNFLSNIGNSKKLSFIPKVEILDRESADVDEESLAEELASIAEGMELEIIDENVHSDSDMMSMGKPSLEIPGHDLLALPEVPKYTDEDIVEASSFDLDADIERRLNRLKFFLSTWCQPSRQAHEVIATGTVSSVPAVSHHRA